MDKKYNIVLASLVATIIGRILFVNYGFGGIPLPPADFSDTNVFLIILIVLIGGIIYLIISLIVLALVIYGFLGFIITPVSFFIALSNKNHSYKHKSYENYSVGNNSCRSYSQESLREIEKEAISKGVLAPGIKGQYIDEKSGKFREDIFFGLLSKNTNRSIDLETGKYQTENFMGGKNDTDTKIDFETGIISEKAFTGYKETGTRINQESGRIEEKGFLGWKKTDKRINPDTGKTQKKDGLLGIFWEDEKD